MRVHWDGERIEALEASDGRSRDLPLPGRRPGRGRADAATRSATAAACSRSPTPTASSRSPTPTTRQGRVIHQLSPFGRNTLFGYLPGHVTVTSDDTDGPTNVFIHDTAGRLLSLLAGDETRVNFQYDA